MPRRKIWTGKGSSAGVMGTLPPPLERETQRAIVNYLNIALPTGSLFFHIPNGGYRTPVEARHFKEIGVVPGVPDLLLILQAPAGGTRPLSVFFEVKRVGETPSADQAHIMAMLRELGCWCFTVESPEHVERALRMLRIPLKATLETQPHATT